MIKKRAAEMTDYEKVVCDIAARLHVTAWKLQDAHNDGVFEEAEALIDSVQCATELVDVVLDVTRNRS